MVEDQPKLARRAQAASFSSTPIAASTWLTETLPDEQVEPELIITPSRSSADQRGFRRQAGNGEAGRAAQPRRLHAEDQRLREWPAFRPASKWSRRWAMRARSPSPSRHGMGRRAEAGDAGKILAYRRAGPSAGRRRPAAAASGAPSRTNQRADALRAAQLVRRQNHVIAEREIQIDLAGGRHRIHQQQAAGFAHQSAKFRQWAAPRRSHCWRPSPPPGRGPCLRAGRRAGLPDRSRHRPCTGKRTTRTQGKRSASRSAVASTEAVLDGRNEQTRVMRALLDLALASEPSMAPNSARLFASVAPLVKITCIGLGAHQRGDLFARLFHHRARRAALGMHRRRIAADRQRMRSSPKAIPGATAKWRCDRR